MIFELRLKQKFWDLRSFDLGENEYKTRNIGKRLIVAWNIERIDKMHKF